MALVSCRSYISAAMGQNNNSLNRALLGLLRPLARLCLHFGFGYREYCELSKAAFVDVAAEDFGVHGRPTNVSRIAAMTGLTRKEISRLRKRIDRDEVTQPKRSTPVREILNAWQSVDEFLDEKGCPRILPLEGQRGSFQSLVRQFAGDIPDGAMRKELERMGAAQLKEGALRLTPRDTAEVEAAEVNACAVLGEAQVQLESLTRGVNS